MFFWWGIICNKEVLLFLCSKYVNFLDINVANWINLLYLSSQKCCRNDVNYFYSNSKCIHFDWIIYQNKKKYNILYLCLLTRQMSFAYLRLSLISFPSFGLLASKIDETKYCFIFCLYIIWQIFLCRKPEYYREIVHFERIDEGMIFSL